MLTVFKMKINVKSLTRPDLVLKLEDISGITEQQSLSGGVEWSGKFKYDISDTGTATTLMSGEFDMPDGAKGEVKYVEGCPVIETAFVRESIMYLGMKMFEEKLKPFVEENELFQKDEITMKEMNVVAESIDEETMKEVMMAQQLIETVIEPLTLVKLLPKREYEGLRDDVIKVLKDGTIDDTQVLSWNNRWAMDVCSNGVAALMSKMYDIKIDIVYGGEKRVLH